MDTTASVDSYCATQLQLAQSFCISRTGLPFPMRIARGIRHLRVQSATTLSRLIPHVMMTCPEDLTKDPARQWLGEPFRTSQGANAEPRGLIVPRRPACEQPHVHALHATAVPDSRCSRKCPETRPSSVRGTPLASRRRSLTRPPSDPCPRPLGPIQAPIRTPHHLNRPTADSCLSSLWCGAP